MIVSRATNTEESIAAKNERARVAEQLSSTPWLQRMHMNDLLSVGFNAHDAGKAIARRP